MPDAGMDVSNPGNTGNQEPVNVRVHGVPPDPSPTSALPPNIKRRRQRRLPEPKTKNGPGKVANDKILDELVDKDGRSITPEDMERRMAIAESLMVRGYDTIQEIADNVKVSPDLAKLMMRRVYIRWETQTRLAGAGGSRAKSAVRRKLQHLYRKLAEIFEEEQVHPKQKITAIKTAMENLKQQAQLLGIVGIPGVSNVNIGEVTVKRFDDAQRVFVKAVGQALREELDPATLERVLRRIADINTSEGMARTLQNLHNLDGSPLPAGALEAEYTIEEDAAL